MSSPASPAETRAFIVERLVGDSGAPDIVSEAANRLARRVVKPIEEALAPNLSFPVVIESEPIALARLSTALAQTVDNHAVFVLSSVLGRQSGIIDIEPAAITLLVSALFGGDTDSPAPVITRPLSSIERDVAGTALRQIVPVIDAALPSPIKLQPLEGPALTGVELHKLELRDAPAARLTLVLKAGNSIGRIFVTLTQRSLISQKSALPVRADDIDASLGTAWSARIEEEVRKSTVTVDAIVPLSKMSLGALSRLKVGQVLEMPATAQSSTRLSARNKTLFTCEFGKLGENYSIRIKQPFDEGQDLVDSLLPR